MVAQIPTTIGFGAYRIYLGYVANNFDELFTSSDNTTGKIIFAVAITLTIVILFYISWFAKKKMKELGVEEKLKEQEEE